MKYKITIKQIPEDKYDNNYEDELIFTVDGQHSIDRFIEVFKMMLYFIGFVPETIKSYLKTEDELEMEAIDNEKKE